MPFIKKEKNFKIENNKIILSDSYINSNKSKFKKITGSRLASIIGENQYCSEVKVWAMMVNIYSELMDPIYANAGNIIEPKIKDYVEEVLKIKYLSYDPKKIGFDIFKDNKIFGGIPDGEPLNKNNELDYPNKPMLEIKTTSIDAFEFTKKDGSLWIKRDENNLPIIKSKGTKKEKWFDKNGEIVIPSEYKFQLGLYCYLRNIKSGVFAIAFLEYEDYIMPENFNPSEREIKIVNFELNNEEFKKVINYCEWWFKNYVEKGISPNLNSNDITWLKENKLYE